MTRLLFRFFSRDSRKVRENVASTGIQSGSGLTMIARNCGTLFAIFEELIRGSDAGRRVPPVNQCSVAKPAPWGVVQLVRGCLGGLRNSFPLPVGCSCLCVLVFVFSWLGACQMASLPSLRQGYCWSHVGGRSHALYLSDHACLSYPILSYIDVAFLTPGYRHFPLSRRR